MTTYLAWLIGVQESEVQAYMHTTQWPSHWTFLAQHQMRALGMVVLTGTAYYRVVTVGPRHFCGRIWNEGRKEWAGIRTVPLPSPTQSAYVVENAAALFPLS